ncbi:MAG: UDP-N-acetylmuramate:L-alanyl-gamma-D-glutamyl-meso-diaminopimelate ligase [Pseudohongiellaceae bacterium]
MHVHILGICGTFMGSLAVLAKQLGHKVSGSDANVYPPMSTQLQDQGIELTEGFNPAQLKPRPDLVIIGNAMSRGNPAVEFVLNEGIAYTSGPQWLAQYVLKNKWVLGVAGTHGKTTTSSMLAWILEYAGMKPGYLIGGVTNNFDTSARIGESDFFVVEADEYDTAFFDKRSKFVHYAPRTVVLNNLEFDHADIFDSLKDIKKQFHHLVRTIPSSGLIIYPEDDEALESVLEKGCWSPCQQLGVSVPNGTSSKRLSEGATFWNVDLLDAHGGKFEITKLTKTDARDVISRATVNWDLTGIHNVKNAVAAIAAAHHVGVDLKSAADALQQFKGVKRRMEFRGQVAGVSVYDDFAHHPTAIQSTLEGMAAKLANENQNSRLIAIIEPRSNTMKLGVHQQALVAASQNADRVIWLKPQEAELDIDSMITASEVSSFGFDSADEIVSFVKDNAQQGDHIVVMSNGGFDGIHEKLLSELAAPA